MRNVTLRESDRLALGSMLPSPPAMLVCPGCNGTKLFIRSVDKHGSNTYHDEPFSVEIRCRCDECNTSFWLHVEDGGVFDEHGDENKKGSIEIYWD